MAQILTKYMHFVLQKTFIVSRIAELYATKGKISYFTDLN